MRKLILILVAAGALGTASAASASTGARLTFSAPAPVVLGMHAARSALSHYYRTDYFRIYRCTRESLRKVRCNDGLMVGAGSQTVWCDGYDSVTEFAHRVRVSIGGCSMTITVR